MEGLLPLPEKRTLLADGGCHFYTFTWENENEGCSRHKPDQSKGLEEG